MVASFALYFRIKTADLHVKAELGLWYYVWVKALSLKFRVCKIRYMRSIITTRFFDETERSVFSKYIFDGLKIMYTIVGA